MKTKTNNLKVVGFSVPKKYADRVDAITRRERRTKRAVFEAMVDLYEETTQKREEALDTLVNEAIERAEQEKKTTPKSSKQLLREYRTLAKQGKARLEAMGIDPTDEAAIDQLVYDTRKERKTKKRS